MLGILNTLFKIPIKFVADCMKFTKKKEKWDSMHVVSKKSNVL